ncbi:MAG: hypothetical protein K2G25_04190, partial [Oscillospiraceae bacterium]|nr:hypothetical protein [Oscillospiraceae bacterium]
YLQDQETCLRDSYRILSDPETEYLPEDFAYNTIFCFSCVSSLETVPEIYDRIAFLTDGNISEFFDMLDINSIDSQALKTFYLRIETETIRMLQEYNGYCRNQDTDTASGKLRHFLELAVACSDFADYDFRQTAFEQYAKKSRNHIRMQYFADYFLYPSITLTELLNFFADWRLEDFYAGMHPVVFDKFLFPLQYSRLSQNEKKVFLPFLQQYQAFRNALGQQEDPDLLELCEAYPDLIQAQTAVFNACQSHDARALLLFLNKTILGDPVILVCLLELYSRNFLTKQDQKKNDSYYPFYELLLQPLFQADQLSLQDLQYLIWMFEKNNLFTYPNKSNKSRSMKLFQNLEQKFTKTVSAPVLSGKEQAFNDFPEMLLHRLCTDYVLSDPERQSLRDFLEICHADNRKLLCQEEFRNHGTNHIQWLKKYSMQMIKNF